MDNGEARIITKPTRGWLHPDQVVSTKGITYAVRYIGCLEVRTSMKSLDFDTRSQVAKECINRVCEAAGLKTVNKKRKVDKKVIRSIGESPLMEHAGANVNLTISSCSLSISTLESGQVIARHDMPRISFASGGDTDTLDFVAYVAKNLQEWRACYVLECGGGLAQDVISTIGQAFELRFQEFMVKPMSNLSISLDPDHDYYNDLPNKVPPDVAPPVPPLPPLTVHSNSLQHTRASSVSNLIDFNVAGSCPPPDHNYVNDLNVEAAPTNDVFDMQPFSPTVAREPVPMSRELQYTELLKETWFHGAVNRAIAESQLTKDGDFLVRECQGSAHQYVLTGMQGKNIKHLLLIDPQGVVRTKDRMFESVSHLINYHCQNALPIISHESALVLRNPVHRTKQNT